MLGSNFNGDQNKLEKTIILVKTSNVEKLKSKKNKEKEFKRGSQRVKVSTQEEYRRQNRKRIMITFETEAGYNLLLADRKELSKLKTNSYLDLKFLEQNNKYRVHLYYKDKEKTRFSHWLPKYPQVEKTVEIDETDIRIKVDLKENSLSQAIDSIQTENDLSKSVHPRHEKPPSPQELMKARKKVKVIENKTKSQLIVENSDLKASLESLRNDQVQTEKKMQVLLDEQDFYKSLLSEVIEKLSPKTKAQYEHVFDNTPKYKKGNSVENRNDMDNFYIDSPKSRIPTEKGMGENSATSSERIKEMDLFPAGEDISERQGNNVSSSFRHYDEVKYIEKTPSPDTPTGHAENLQALESSCPVKKINNKNRRRKKQTIQKPLWSQMTKGVLTIWQAIKLALQQGESEETLRKNKNTTNSWKPVLDPEYEHRQLFLAFLASG